MRPSEMLRQSNQTDWQAATRHAFCAELADGTLPLDKMRWYLVQDYCFIDGFVRLAASAIAHAPSLRDSIPLAQFLAVITGPENTYFQRSFEALGVVRADRTAPMLAPETRTFQELMAEAAASGRYGDMVAVLTVAEWTYLAWATPFNPPAADLPFYFAEWITLHSGTDFEGVVSYLREQLDRAWEEAEVPSRAEMEQAFGRAVTLERAFFDAAYSAG
ncbi:MAG: TenA family protein [Pseudomonadota bacterium]